jgi:SIR2-like domain
MKIPQSVATAKIVVLTGAGASAPLGRHTTREFLDEFFQVESRSLRIDQKTNELLNLLENEARDSQGDIETVLDLLERRASAAGFLESDPCFLSQSKVSTSERARLLGAYREQTGRIRDAIYEMVVEHYSETEARPAAQLYEGLLSDFPSWFQNVPDLGRTLPLFTLNYDTAVELAVSRLAKPEQPGKIPVRLVDGISAVSSAAERRWRRAAFESYAEDPAMMNIVLVKLHGSVRWGRRALSETRPGDDEIVELPPGVGRNPGAYEHAVLYPTLAPKPVNVEPYRTGFQLFRQCLLGARLAIIVGTSMRDPEVNAILRDSVEDNGDLHVVFVGPNVDHAELSARLSLDPSRVAADKKEFALPPKQGQLLGDLRKLAMQACGVTGYPSLRFGGTL